MDILGLKRPKAWNLEIVLIDQVFLNLEIKGHFRSMLVNSMTNYERVIINQIKL